MKTKLTRDNDVPLKKLSEQDAVLCAAAKQAFLQTLAQSGFKASTVKVSIENDLMTLTGGYVSADKKTTEQADIIGNPQQAEILGRQLAEHMLRF